MKLNESDFLFTEKYLLLKKTLKFKNYNKNSF